MLQRAPIRHIFLGTHAIFYPSSQVSDIVKWNCRCCSLRPKRGMMANLVQHSFFIIYCWMCLLHTIWAIQTSANFYLSHNYKLFSNSSLVGKSKSSVLSAKLSNEYIISPSCFICIPVILLQYTLPEYVFTHTSSPMLYFVSIVIFLSL